MRIHLLEPGLRRKTGHLFDFSLAIAGALSRRGAQVAVLGHQGAHPEVQSAFAQAGIDFLAHFSNEILGADRATVSLDEAERALELHPRLQLDAATQADLWLLPTLTAQALAACSMVADAPPLTGLVHMPPEFHSPNGDRLWRRAIDRAVALGQAPRIDAIDPLVADLVRLHTERLQVSVAPIPHGHWAKQAYAVQPRVVGFFGHQREERGLRGLDSLIGQLLRAGHQVVVQDTSGRIQPKSGHAGLCVLTHFVDDLCDAMAACDVIVCPMDRRRYSQRLSGIACSAQACGVPVVLPAGTLSALRFRPFGGCRTFAEDEASQVVDAVAAVFADYASYAQGARQAARHWAEHHGVERYVDHVLRDGRRS